MGIAPNSQRRNWEDAPVGGADTRAVDTQVVVNRADGIRADEQLGGYLPGRWTGFPAPGGRCPRWSFGRVLVVAVRAVGWSVVVVRADVRSLEGLARRFRGGWAFGGAGCVQVDVDRVQSQGAVARQAKSRAGRFPVAGRFCKKSPAAPPPGLVLGRVDGRFRSRKSLSSALRRSSTAGRKCCRATGCWAVPDWKGVLTGVRHSVVPGLTEALKGVRSRAVPGWKGRVEGD